MQKLRILCEDVRIGSETYRSNNIVLDLENVDPDFISELDINEVVREFELKDILEAIGIDEVEEYLKELKSIAMYDTLKEKQIDDDITG